MNSPTTMKVPDRAPTLITRAKGQKVTYITVLEPFRETSQITGVEATPAKLTVRATKGDVVIHWDALKK